MILRFSDELSNTNWKTRFEGKDEKGNIAMIRLVYGTEDVIEKKQDPNAKQKEFKTGPSNKVVDGVPYYEATIDDAAVIKFLKATPYWEDGRIVEFDPLADNKLKAEALVRDTEVLAGVAALEDKNDIAMYAHYLFGEEALTQAKNDDYAGLKVKLFLYAQENPEEMKELMSEDSNKAEYLEAGLFFVGGIIKEADSGNSVVWGDTSAKFLSVGIGQRPLDAVVDFFGTVEGKEVRQIAGQKMETIVKEKLAKTEAKPKAPAKPAATK